MATVLRDGKALYSGSPTSNAAATPAEFTLSDMATQGVSYVDSVRKEAAKETAKAKAEAAEIRRRAEAEGKSNAEATIARLLDERVGGHIETLKPALESVVRQLDAQQGEWLAHWRESAIRLAAAMAEKIIRRELVGDPTISEEWLAEALRLAAGSSEITVRLAPGDVEHLKHHAETLKESVAGLGEMRFVADASISVGGCRVETRHGSIDNQLQTQLERLTEELA